MCGVAGAAFVINGTSGPSGTSGSHREKRESIYLKLYEVTVAVKEKIKEY